MGDGNPGVHYMPPSTSVDTGIKKKKKYKKESQASARP